MISGLTIAVTSSSSRAWKTNRRWSTPTCVAAEADAVGVAHQVRHLVGEAGQVVVEPLDLVGAHPQHRIRVLANLREGDTTACFLLRVELSLVPLLAAVSVLPGSAALRRHDDESSDAVKRIRHSMGGSTC